MHLEEITTSGSLLSFEAQFPYLVAAAYVLAVSLGIAFAFPVPPPRFMDVYLIGIAFSYARWSMGPALFIYFSSLFFAAWLLPPAGTLVVSEGHDVYRMISYSASVGAVILAISFCKARRRS